MGNINKNCNRDREFGLHNNSNTNIFMKSFIPPVMDQFFTTQSYKSSVFPLKDLYPCVIFTQFCLIFCIVIYVSVLY